MSENSVPDSDQSKPVSALDFVRDALGNLSSPLNLSVEVLVTLLVLKVVRVPEQVKVQVTKSARLTILEFSVRDADIGQVIGKKGHTIDSIRSLAKSASGAADIEYVISVLERGNSMPLALRSLKSGKLDDNS